MRGVLFFWLVVGVGCADGDARTWTAQHALRELPVVYQNPTVERADQPSVDVPLVHEVVYSDVTGADRTVPLVIHLPDGPGPAPVVVWSHGGASGSENPLVSGNDWARVFLEGGYAVVALAHLPRDHRERKRLCVEIGVEEQDCPTFKHLTWDRPQDLTAVVDWLEAVDPVLGARLDLERLVFAGHSSGGGGALTAAGAHRSYGGALVDVSDPRPIAFIACSPQGPEEDGFVPESFVTVTRPVLVISGEGDDTPGTRSEDRRASFDLLGGEHWLAWATEDVLVHMSFDHETASCVDDRRDDGDQRRCTNDLQWLDMAALAFLDAHTRDDADAHAWLASDELAVISDGVMTLSPGQ